MPQRLQKVLAFGRTDEVLCGKRILRAGVRLEIEALPSCRRAQEGESLTLARSQSSAQSSIAKRTDLSKLCFQSSPLIALPARDPQETVIHITRVYVPSRDRPRWVVEVRDSAREGVCARAWPAARAVGGKPSRGANNALTIKLQLC